MYVIPLKALKGWGLIWDLLNYTRDPQRNVKDLPKRLSQLVWSLSFHQPHKHHKEKVPQYSLKLIFRFYSHELQVPIPKIIKCYSQPTRHAPSQTATMFVRSASIGRAQGQGEPNQPQVLETFRRLRVSWLEFFALTFRWTSWGQ